MKMRLIRSPWYNGVQILIKDGDHVGVSVQMEKATPGMKVDPTLEIEDRHAQVLMDDLWQAGFRPTEGTGSAGSLAATQKHLEDMRTLVFKE